MKRFILAGLSVIALSVASASAAEASNRSNADSWSDRVNTTRTQHNRAFDNTSNNSSITVAQATSESSNEPENARLNNSSSWSDRVSATRSQRNSTFNNPSSNRSVTQATPFDLVFLARKGYFQEQGIPSYGSFHTSVRTGQISAEDIVKAAIAENRVSSEVLNDRGYLNAVERKLARLSRN
jgi:hypothetical protein